VAEVLAEFGRWVSGFAISGFIRESTWLWPVCEILHFFGLSLIVGVAGFFDLRLLGFFRGVPLRAAWSLLPWAKAGFALAALTGLVFLVGTPAQYLDNRAFFFKVVFLVIAGLNALFFETRYGKAVLAGQAGDQAPPAAYKRIAAVSLVAWFFVIYWGRMLPFIGNAF
jgi:hypothetical protein